MSAVESTLSSPDASVSAPAIGNVHPAVDRREANRGFRLIVGAMLLIGLAAAALWIDLPLALAIRQHGLPGDLTRLVRLGETFGWGGTVAILILAAALLDPRGWRIVPRLAICAFGAGLTADVLKLFLGRWRPMAASLEADIPTTFAAWLPAWRAESLGLEYGHAMQSFPSGHAATAAGLAIALSILYPRGRWLFAALAALALVQRIDSQSHFASDVLAGAALGCLFGAACDGILPLRNWLGGMESHSQASLAKPAV